MKNIRVFCLTLGLLGLVHQGIAQESPQAAEHAALRGLRGSLVEALNKQDVAALAPHLAKEFVYTGIDQTVITELAGLDAFFTRVFTAPDAPVENMTIEAEPTTLTRFIADNVGVCYGTAKETYKLKNGKDFVLNSRWTATCLKEDGAWKISAIQSGVNVLDNTLLNNTQKLCRNGALVGLIVGLLFGIMGTLFIRRQKRTA
jgi:hypothetical protein